MENLGCLIAITDKVSIGVNVMVTDELKDILARRALLAAVYPFRDANDVSLKTLDMVKATVEANGFTAVEVTVVK